MRIPSRLFGATLVLALLACGAERLAPDADTVGWLAANSQPFRTDAPTSELSDLSEIGAIVGAARVVAFGDATNGTREFYRMKQRTFQYLVEREGFTHFVIDAPMPASRAIDRYIANGDGDPKALLSAVYWNSKELLDLVEWMRAYNVRVGVPRLRFFGIDMQSPERSIGSVVWTLSRLDAAIG